LVNFPGIHDVSLSPGVRGREYTHHQLHIGRAIVAGAPLSRTDQAPGLCFNRQEAAPSTSPFCFCPHILVLRRMLRSVRSHLFLAFGNPGFASDEHRSGRQPITGAALSVIEKSDEKDHLSPRRPTGIHLVASQPDATGFSGEESQAENAGPESTERTAPDGAPSPAIQPGLRPVLAPKASKSAQA
jgi:hypothetical protein